MANLVEQRPDDKYFYAPEKIDPSAVLPAKKIDSSVAIEPEKNTKKIRFT